MTSATEKQGYLGNLAAIPEVELLALLKRQECLLQNKRFIRTLPDKGEKIEAFLNKIKDTLKQLRDIDSTADDFQKLSMKTEQARNRGWGTNSAAAQDKTDEDKLIEQLLQRREEQKIVIDERQPVSNESQPQFSQSYENIKLREKKPHKAKFTPNKTKRALHKLQQNSELTSQLHTSPVQKDIVVLDHVDDKNMDLDGSVHSMEDNHSVSIKNDISKSVIDTAEKDDAISTNIRLKYRYDESLEEASIGKDAKCTSSQLLSIEESIDIMKTQQEKLKEIREKHAIEKLGERLHTNMTAFHPERLHTNMTAFHPEGTSFTSYRDVEGEIKDEDSDSDEDDYPD